MRHLSCNLFQKPFLDGAEHLTEDAVTVFPVADSLEQYIIAIITSACEEENAEVLCKRLSLYQVPHLDFHYNHYLSLFQKDLSSYAFFPSTFS